MWLLVTCMQVTMKKANGAGKKYSIRGKEPWPTCHDSQGMCGRETVTAEIRTIKERPDPHWNNGESDLNREKFA